jgi:hypothetical protein
MRSDVSDPSNRATEPAEPKESPPAQRMRWWGFSHKAGIPGRREVAALFRLRVGGDGWSAAGVVLFPYQRGMLYVSCSTE